MVREMCRDVVSLRGSDIVTSSFGRETPPPVVQKAKRGGSQHRKGKHSSPEGHRGAFGGLL